jgi:nanoRNase/pAp phosphatase (c-di-AMP/oligoRNAs hydrolase)
MINYIVIKNPESETKVAGKRKKTLVLMHGFGSGLVGGGHTEYAANFNIASRLCFSLTTTHWHLNLIESLLSTGWVWVEAVARAATIPLACLFSEIG